MPFRCKHISSLFGGYFLIRFNQKLYLCDADFAHVYNKFFGPLPLTPEDFVSSVHKYFAYMIDTKILLNTNNLLKRLMKNGTSLSKAFASLCPQIASSSKNSGLAFQPYIEVEVQVDDMRFGFPTFPSGIWNSTNLLQDDPYLNTRTVTPEIFVTSDFFVHQC